jgi:hypothetical protein
MFFLHLYIKELTLLLEPGFTPLRLRESANFPECVYPGILLLKYIKELALLLKRGLAPFRLRESANSPGHHNHGGDLKGNANRPDIMSGLQN